MFLYFIIYSAAYQLCDVGNLRNLSSSVRDWDNKNPTHRLLGGGIRCICKAPKTGT